MRKSVPLFLSFVLLLAACGNDKTTDETDVAAAVCVTDEECPTGSCVDGQCVSFTPDEDLRSESDALAPVDAVTKPGDDATADDAQETPDDTTTDQAGTADTTPVTSAPNIVVDPLDHTFTYVPGIDNPQTKAVTIYNDGNWSLNITKIEWDQYSSPEFTFMALPPLPKKLNPYEQTSVTVVFKEKQPHGPATLKIHSDDPDTPVVSVQFWSESKTGDQACMQIVPGNLNFGQVVRGDIKTMDFQVVNCSSTVPLTINNIKRSQFFGMPLTDEFQITPMPNTPFTLTPNSVQPLSVTYSPGLAGVDQGYFSFIPADSTLADGKLDLYGVGVPPPMEEIGLHIEMEWDVDNSDVDMHLVKPGGTLFDCDDDCYYANMSPDWGTQGSTLDDPFLDYDDVDGYGPENTNISEPQPGTYKVVMHYYNDAYEGWSGGPTNVTVRVYSYGQLLATYTEKLQYTNHVWDVCNVVWPGATITTLGALYDAPDQPMCMPW